MTPGPIRSTIPVPGSGTGRDNLGCHFGLKTPTLQQKSTGLRKKSWTELRGADGTCGRTAAGAAGSVKEVVSDGAEFTNPG